MNIIVPTWNALEEAGSPQIIAANEHSTLHAPGCGQHAVIWVNSLLQGANSDSAYVSKQSGSGWREIVFVMCRDANIRFSFHFCLSKNSMVSQPD